MLESQVMLKRRILLGILLFTLLLGQTSRISAQKKFALTIDNIMRGPELYGNEPTAPRWSDDGQHVYFQWKQVNEPRIKPNDTYVVNRDGSGLRKLSEEETKKLPPAFGSRTRDRKRIGLCGERRHFHLRLLDRHEAAAHQDVRRRDQSAVHAGRKTGHVHARRKSLRHVARQRACWNS